jgi:hypothetical protein
MLRVERMCLIAEVLRGGNGDFLEDFIASPIRFLIVGMRRA